MALVLGITAAYVLAAEVAKRYFYARFRTRAERAVNQGE